MITPKEQKQVAVAVHILSEFFPSVQILVSRVEPDGTYHMFLGAGDWYARRGLTQAFLDHGKANDDASILSQYLKKE